jgi:hypothetical protein
MTPELDRFLDLATRPLEAVPAERDEAKGELMARVGHAGVPYDMLDLTAPLERLATSKPANPWVRRVSLLAALLVSIGTVVTGLTIQSREFTLMSMATMLSFMANYGGGTAAMENPLLADYVRRHAPDLPLGRDLLALDGGKDETGDWLGANPDDLAMLQEKVARRIRAADPWTGLEPLEKDAVARLDAGNALWPLMQVTPHLARATAASMSSRTGTTVTDEAEFQNALRHFSEAAAKPAYTDRSLSLKRRQIDAFPPSRTLADDMIIAGIAQMVTSPYEPFTLGLGSLAAIQCERLVKAGDKDGLVRFFNDWKQLTRAVADSPEPADPQDQGILHQLRMMAPAFGSAFDQLGMAVEKSELEERERLLEHNSLLSHSAPLAAGARINMLTHAPSDLTDAEILPSRRTELAFFDRAMGSFLALLGLIFSGLVGLETCRRSRIVKGMARGLMPLFRMADHGWIGALGLAFPWLWWWGITRLSPLGLRDLKFDEWNVMAWLLQPIAGFIFGLVLLLQTARWRWGMQGGFLGLGGSIPWLGWAVAGLAGMAVPAAGMLRYLTLNDEQSGLFLLGVSGMSACGLLWLLWEGVMNLFTPRSSALRPNLVMRALLPWTLAGVLTLMASVAISTKMERHWFMKDPLLPTWTSKTHRNALEERAAAERKISMQTP